MTDRVAVYVLRTLLALSIIGLAIAVALHLNFEKLQQHPHIGVIGIKFFQSVAHL